MFVDSKEATDRLNISKETFHLGRHYRVNLKTLNSTFGELAYENS